MSSNEKLKKYGLLTNTLPLHDDFVKLLTDCANDEQKLREADSVLDRINTTITNQISRVCEQQKELLKKQMEISRTLISGLALPEDDATHNFCKNYIYSLIANQEEGGSDVGESS